MRGKQAKKRKLEPDLKYKSPLVSRIINSVMLHGKKDLAKRIVYTAIEDAAAKVKMDPMDFLNSAINNVKPEMEVKARRVGGANYQVPIPVNPIRQETLAVRWIVNIARSKSGAPMSQRLTRELLDAYKKEGDAIKKKEDMHRMAEANKAFAHFRW